MRYLILVSIFFLSGCLDEGHDPGAKTAYEIQQEYKAKELANQLVHVSMQVQSEIANDPRYWATNADPSVFGQLKLNGFGIYRDPKAPIDGRMIADKP